MEASFWDGKRAPGIADKIDLDQFHTLRDVIEHSVKSYGDRPAYTSLGKTITFNDVDRLSTEFAAYLQNHTTLKPGDKIALQMPNLIQYPVVAYGAIKAGLVIVNTNPLYTAREMKHQFNDSGAKALVCLNVVGHLVEEIIKDTPVEHLIVTELADMLPWPKRSLLNLAVKHVKKMVQPYNLPQAVPFTKVMKLGASSTYTKPAAPDRDDIAVLQYTGGTTGVAKGAMLTHRNLVSNVLQTSNVMTQFDENGQPIIGESSTTAIAPLPLYHIYAFTIHLMTFFQLGGHSVLIANPRDMDTFVKALVPHKMNVFVGLNTLFVGLMNHPQFKQLDFSALKLTLSGGTALQAAVAERWNDVTGCTISEGYGLSETSPVVSFNPAGKYTKIGTVGLPMVASAVKTIDDEGNDLPFGERGELCVKGPQVMKGYLNRPEATAEVLSEDGWFKTGDVAVIDDTGFVKIVDRLKDMVLVSGFNVYPNEIEDVVSKLDKVMNCAVIGVPDEKTGEAVKLFVIPQDKELTAEEVKEYCKLNLTAYKVPKQIEFRDELPVTPVGKVLRKDLRAEELKKREALAS
ncbi:AMP-binding protein [Endozoicomonas ascidiicola]|uniref:AMP-binding protein n=1 Tax=Endozoicomonas ascidiicola TaxID=1698521 RepID=UPI000834391C|nr:AMP-binding protein [Endozoicomonas ascidiicola]